MKEYLNAEDLTAETIENGWLKTGDLGKMTDGHLILLGRKKNMIVTAGGKNVYPEDVETVFDRIEGVDEYCVLAETFAECFRQLAHDSMILVVKPKENTRSHDLLNEIRVRNRSLSDYKRVSQILMWNSPFARTASLKIKRNELAAEIGKTLSTSESGIVTL